ncbi:het-s domain-containing protein [Fusarium circinatum]|uniref:Het-s domain-containing protein n=1 Tax=Fusarium circinatum TaxID=48490 RepID=A0A8H5U5Q8_FUSCI|nr:het-s domain-containing protein [Fusarium circinatum]
MEIAGIVLASGSAAHELIQCGIRIYRRIRDEKKLVLVLQDFQMFNLEDRRAQLGIDIKLAQGVLKSQKIENEHKERLKQNWERIKSLLIQVDDLIETMVQNSSAMATRARHKARDALLNLGGTKAISITIQEFQSVVLALRELERDESELFLSPRDFQPLEKDSRVYGPSRNSFFGKGRLTDPPPGVPNGPQWFLFESKPYDHQIPQKKEEVKDNLRILAQKLHQAQQDKGVLRLIGFRDEIDDKQGSFQLVFACPFEGKYPPNLESYLKDPTTPSLNLRVNLCSQLATAVLQAQSLGLVHKNVRPENILLLPSTPTVGAVGESDLGVFLTGWQYARQVEMGVTYLKGETLLQRKIYQHPERQLLQAEKEYSMSHDAYSLGVCMIEILTWKSLLVATEPPTMSQDFIEAFQRLGLQPDVGALYTKYPDQIKQTLCCICDELLPTVAGNKMARLVKDFLTCLDAEDELDENEPQQYAPTHDKDRRREAIHFVDTALKALRDFQSAI